MTREEAIKVLEMFLHKQCDLGRTEFAYDADTVWEAVNMASKALKQETVLDKIRAEIEQVIREETVVDCSGGEYERIVSTIDLDDVLEILDKYKAESEEV